MEFPELTDFVELLQPKAQHRARKALVIMDSPDEHLALFSPLTSTSHQQ
jgi:hypothetical protein